MIFKNLPPTELIAKSATATKALTPELYQNLISLLPTPESCISDHDHCEACFTASLKGNPEDVKAFEAASQKVNQNLTILSLLAKAGSLKDPTVPQKFGFLQLLDKTSHAASTAPGDARDFRISFDKEGRPHAWVARVQRAKGYEIWFCDGDPAIEENWKMLVWSTKCQKIPLSGLNRSKTNFLKIRGKRNDAAGPWSNYIRLNPA